LGLWKRYINAVHLLFNIYKHYNVHKTTLCISRACKHLVTMHIHYNIYLSFVGHDMKQEIIGQNFNIRFMYVFFIENLNVAKYLQN